MKSPARFLAVAASVAMLFPICGFLQEAAKAPIADIIVTATPVYEPLAAMHGRERFPKGAQLLLIHEGKAEPLVSGFAATADADVSFDGETVLFAGKQSATDPWQIWELTFATHSMRKVVPSETDAIRPLHLPSNMPGGRLFTHIARRMAFNWRTSGSMNCLRNTHRSTLCRRLFSSHTARQAFCLRMYLPMAESCLRPAIHWA